MTQLSTITGSSNVYSPAEIRTYCSSAPGNCTFRVYIRSSRVATVSSVRGPALNWGTSLAPRSAPARSAVAMA